MEKASSASGGIDRLTNSTDMLGKAGQEQRVEDAAGPSHDHILGLFLGIGRFIDPGMHQGVKGVRQPHHLYPGGNTVPSQPVRVTGTVPSLMVVAAHIADGGERLALPQLRYPLQQATALGGVRLHYTRRRTCKSGTVR